MKKLILALLALMVLITIIGCPPKGDVDDKFGEGPEDRVIEDTPEGDVPDGDVPEGDVPADDADPDDDAAPDDDGADEGDTPEPEEIE